MSNLNVPNRSIFCHDNLEVLQGINSASIDLIYLDPPFNKNKRFVAPIGSSAEGAEFSDIFREEDVKAEWVETIKEDHPALSAILSAVKQVESKTAIYNYCYLCYMAIRLIECQRVLKDTGSIYLHCDPTMSHHLKLVMDCAFGEEKFRNEIIWYYKTGGASKRYFSRKHDVILYYAKGNKPHFNYQKEKSYLTHHYGFSNVEIRDDNDGNGPYTIVGCRDVWDIPAIRGNQPQAKGYPTQKPLALLERIIEASSKEGDMVLDPFCGCATTCVAAEALGRHWIGIDVSIKAYDLVRERISDTDRLLVPKACYNFQTTPPTRTDTDGDNRERKSVYIISNPKYPGRFKVGIAANVKSRLNAYQIGDPDRRYKLEDSVETPYYKALEKHIHTIRNNDYEWVEGPVDEIKAQMKAFLKGKH